MKNFITFLAILLISNLTFASNFTTTTVINNANANITNAAAAVAESNECTCSEEDRRIKQYKQRANGVYSVKTDPETGKKSLYKNGVFVKDIVPKKYVY